MKNHPLPAQKKIASLLGLTETEYEQLSHGGLRAVTDSRKNVLQYYMIISPLNPEYLLDKLKMDKRNTVYFPPDMLEYEDLRCVL